MTKRRLFKAVSELDIKKKDQEYEIPGVLGFILAGEETVEVPTRDSFVFVRLRNNNNELIQAFNDQVSPVYGLPVLVVRDKVDKGRYKIVGRDLGQYSNWGSSAPYLARHGNQHSFNPDSGGGGDIVWVFGRQFMPLLGYPSGSSASPRMMIHSYTYYDGSSWNFVGNTGTADLTTYKPTGSNARIVLVYINEFGNPDYRAGNFFNASITGTAEIVPYIPNPPTGTAFPVSAVRLVSGTSVISWGNLYDVRPFFDLSGTSSGLGGTGDPTLMTLFTVEGAVSVASNPLRIYNNFSDTKTISKVFLSVNTPPTDSSIIVDVNKGGTTIFTTQGNRPVIAAGANTGESSNIDVFSWADGEYLTMDVDQIGSGTAGSDLTVHISYY